MKTSPCEVGAACVGAKIINEASQIKPSHARDVSNTHNIASIGCNMGRPRVGKIAGRYGYETFWYDHLKKDRQWYLGLKNVRTFSSRKAFSADFSCFLGNVSFHRWQALSLSTLTEKIGTATTTNRGGALCM